MTLSLEGWPTKAKEAPSPHEVRLAPLDTNPVFQRNKHRKKLPSKIFQSYFTAKLDSRRVFITI